MTIKNEEYRNNVPPISVTIDEAIRISGLGRTTLYNLAKNDKLRLRRIGRRTLIMVEDLRRVIETEAA